MQQLPGRKQKPCGFISLEPGVGLSVSAEMDMLFNCCSVLSLGALRVPGSVPLLHSNRAGMRFLQEGAVHLAILALCNWTNLYLSCRGVSSVLWRRGTKGHPLLCGFPAYLCNLRTFYRPRMMSPFSWRRNKDKCLFTFKCFSLSALALPRMCLC